MRDNFISILKDLLYWKIVGKNRISIPKVMEDAEEKTINIIANGRSSEKIIRRMKSKEINENEEFLFMNKMIIYEKEMFFAIKPKYYIAIDPVLFNEERESSIINEPAEYSRPQIIREYFEEVDWDFYFVTSAYSDFKVNNPYVHMIYFSPIESIMDKEYIYKMYAKNYCVPSLINVSVAAIYFCITWGYKNIKIYGLDFDFIKDVYVDENNYFYMGTDYVYRKEKVLDNLFSDRVNVIEKSRIIGFYENCLQALKGFEATALYAKKMGVNVMNMSPYSLVDVFQKGQEE